MKQPTPNLLAIVGPTASGKTELGLRLARERNGEIISVDSRQVYRHLAVGTAKPNGTWQASPPTPLPAREGGPPTPLRHWRPPETQWRKAGGEVYLVEGIPYHLVDMWEPDQAFTAADFVRLAEDTIEDVRRRGKTPVLVGGTGLYFKALREGLAPLPPRDEDLRAQLLAIADEKGRRFLHQELAHVDPEAAGRIPANNIQRVLRALEVHRLTGKPISSWHQEHQAGLRKRPPRYTFEMIGIDWTRDALHLRIEERCLAMLDHGMIEETEALLNKGLAPDCPALTGLGYPRIVAYLEERLSEDHLADALIGDTRHYAKRQMTWFRNQCDVNWIPWKKS